MITEAKTFTLPTGAKLDRRQAFDVHIAQAQEAIGRRDWTSAERFLDRAHVIGQPSAVDHVRAHVWMLVCGWKKRDGAEIVGQVWRLLVAAPASLLGKYPAGNTGRTNVSGFSPMPIAPDLRELLGQTSSDGERRRARS